MSCVLYCLVHLMTICTGSHLVPWHSLTALECPAYESRDFVVIVFVRISFRTVTVYHPSLLQELQHTFMLTYYHDHDLVFFVCKLDRGTLTVMDPSMCEPLAAPKARAIPGSVFTTHRS